MSTVVDVVIRYLPISGPALVTAVIVAAVVGLLIVTGAGARIVTFVQQVTD